MKARHIAVIIAVVLLSGALGCLMASAEECSSCGSQEEATLRARCPFTKLIKCWCEDPPDWVCCLYEYCDVAYAGGPCTDCETYESCFVYYPCDGPYPTKAQCFGGVGVL